MKRGYSALGIMFLVVFIACAGCTRQGEDTGGRPVEPGGVPVKPIGQGPKKPGADDAALLVKGKEDVKKLYATFAESFQAALSKGDTADALRERVELAEKTRRDALVLSATIADPDGVRFLVDLSERLERYRDMAQDHMKTLDEVTRLRNEGARLDERMKPLPDKERAPLLAEYNAIVTRHNSLVKGKLADERAALDAASRELVSLKFK